MRNSVTLYTKTMRLIDSCQTTQQLRTAHKYLMLARNRMCATESLCAYELFGSKVKSILSKD